MNKYICFNMIKVLPTSRWVVMLRVRLFAKCNDETLTPKHLNFSP